MKKRYGMIEVTREVIEINPGELARIFGRISFLPLSAVASFPRNIIEYIGYSPRFDEISEGQKAPRYFLSATKENGRIGKILVERDERNNKQP